TTNNPLDLAMTREDAFYLVQTKDGEIRLSKDGNFQLNEEGYLVNKQGYRILSSDYFNNPQNAGIRLPNGAVYINVDKNGSIEVDGVQNARLFIAQV
ncbi:flagellar biosynthesis protein FlgG, partial [Campylobacter jejuni]